MSQINWDKETEDNFTKMVEKVPIFLRTIAQEKVNKRIEKILRIENRSEVTEKDLVDAFFAETPFGFHGPMKTDMTDLGIDYTKYGYEK